MTIDINELRRLAQAATSGEWYVERGNHIYGRNEVTDGEEVWHPVIACTDDDEVNVNFEANAAFIAAANPAAVSEIIDRLEAAESDAAHQKALADSALRVAEGWEGKCNSLRAKIEVMKGHLAMMKNEIDAGRDCANKPPFKVLIVESDWPEYEPTWKAIEARVTGAQPAPSVPEGWKLVPVEPTETMISEGSCASGLPGPHYISEDCAKQCWEYMLAAAPEAKP